MKVARPVSFFNQTKPAAAVSATGDCALLYVDIPAPSDIAALATFRGEGCVSIYLRTTPVTPQAQGDPKIARLWA